MTNNMKTVSCNDPNEIPSCNKILLVRLLYSKKWLKDAHPIFTMGTTNKSGGNCQHHDKSFLRERNDFALLNVQYTGSEGLL